MENLPLELDKPLKLKEETRKKLQRVYGKLVTLKELKNLQGKIVTVGDIVTETLLKMGKSPHVAIVDYKTKRGAYRSAVIENFGEEVIEVENPPGTITPALWNAVRQAISSRKSVKIVVKGEEDLAVIPAVHFVPIGATVIYGMPNMGVVLITVTKDDKKKVREIIQEMEV